MIRVDNEMRVSEYSYDKFVSLTFLYLHVYPLYWEVWGRERAWSPNWLTFTCLTDYFHFFMPFQSCIDHLEAFVRHGTTSSLLLKGKRDGWYSWWMIWIFHFSICLFLCIILVMKFLGHVSVITLQNLFVSISGVILSNAKKLPTCRTSHSVGLAFHHGQQQ